MRKKRPKLIVDTNFVQWPKEMAPGHCFVWTKPPENLTFYSVVLETDPEMLRLGYRLTRTYGGPLNGQQALVPQDVAVQLLSREQMELARNLGWPQDQSAFMRICAVPPN